VLTEISNVNPIILHFNRYYTNNLLRMIALSFDLSMRAFNVEPAHDNRATAGAAADSDFQDAVLPMATMISQAFQADVVDHFAEEPNSLILSITDTEPRGEEAEANLATQFFVSNIGTLNETRNRAGLEPLGPAGDIFSNGVTLSQLEEKVNTEETQNTDRPQPLD
jgi:hypothetical protein